MPRKIDTKPDETSAGKQSGIRRFFGRLLRPRQSSTQSQLQTRKIAIIEHKKQLALCIAERARLDKRIAYLRQRKDAGEELDEELEEMEKSRERLASFIEDEKTRLRTASVTLERERFAQRLVPSNLRDRLKSVVLDESNNDS